LKRCEARFFLRFLRVTIEESSLEFSLDPDPLGFCEIFDYCCKFLASYAFQFSAASTRF